MREAADASSDCVTTHPIANIQTIFRSTDNYITLLSTSPRVDKTFSTKINININEDVEAGMSPRANELVAGERKDGQSFLMVRAENNWY